MNEDIMRKMGFGKQMDLVKAGKCPMCSKKVFQSELRNEIEKNEFKISGMCHACQEQTFKTDGSEK